MLAQFCRASSARVPFFSHKALRPGAVSMCSKENVCVDELGLFLWRIYRFDVSYHRLHRSKLS